MDSESPFRAVLAAVSGAPVRRVVTALTFAPPEALSVSAPGGPAHALVNATIALQVDLVFVPSWEPWAPRAVRLLAEAAVATAWVVRGPLWPALEAVGLEAGLQLTVRDPSRLAPHLDLQADRSRSAVAAGLRLGSSFVVIAEDLAGAEGPLFAPDYVFAEVMPRLESIMEFALEDDVPVLLHTDGDSRVFLSALTRAGFSGIHGGGGLAREAFERLFWAARRLGLGFVGGISSRDLVSPARAMVAGTSASLLANAGGLVVADDGGIHRAEEMRLLATALAASRVASPVGRDDD